MNSKKIEDILCEATGIKQGRKESRTHFLERLAIEGNKLSDSDWENLPEPVTDWLNKAIAAVKEEEEVVEFENVNESDLEPDPEEDEEEEEEEGEEEEDDEQPSEEEDDEEGDEPEEEEKETKVATKKSKKKATSSKAKKSAEKKTSVGKPGRPAQFSNDAIIHLKVKENPRRPGTAAFKKFALYKEGMKVSAYIKAGGGRGNIRTDVKRGNVSVEELKKKKS